jgi:hypothetical protein
MTGPPRNVPAIERGRRHVRAVRRAWLDLLEPNPFRDVEAKAIRRRLPPDLRHLSDQTLRYYMHRIRRDAEAAVASGADLRVLYQQPLNRDDNASNDTSCVDERGNSPP